MTVPLRVLVDGVESDRISVLDRGVHYGDGVFRSLRVERGSPRDWPRHLNRLNGDAQRIGLAVPHAEMLTDQVMKLCASQSRAVLKIVLTRGPGGRGYQCDKVKPSCILLLYPVPQYPGDWWESGVQLRFCETRLAQNPRLAGIKHLNRLEQVLARAEWNDPTIAEGLMLDTDDRLIEGVSSNLFLLRNGELLTPDLSRCGIAGVTREMILELAPAYTKGVHIIDLNYKDLLASDECFICNSVIGIWPVRRLENENKEWKVGPVIRKLQQYFGDVCQHAV